MISFPVYIGWDSRQCMAYDVCEHSLIRRSTTPLNIIPLKQQHLRKKGIYTRNTDALGSTEFTFTRFFVPYLQDYNGWALFFDCDMLWLDDISNLIDNIDDKYAVMVVKHKEYEISNSIKMDGMIQYSYPRKNWSSMILWNCSHEDNKKLSTEILNSKDGKFLHRFAWIPDEHIGSLDIKWNYLEGIYNIKEHGYPSVVHYTHGNIYFKNHQNVDFAQEWKDEYKLMEGVEWISNNIIDA